MMHSKPIRFGALTALAALALASGCLNTVFVASEDAHITTKRSETGRYFQVRYNNYFTFWGLNPHIRVIEIDRLVSDHRHKKITKITGLKITQHITWWNWVVQTVTGGIYNPRTLIIEGRTHEPGTGAPPSGESEKPADESG